MSGDVFIRLDPETGAGTFTVRDSSETFMAYGIDLRALCGDPSAIEVIGEREEFRGQLQEFECSIQGEKEE